MLFTLNSINKEFIVTFKQCNLLVSMLIYILA